jgi:hypothetical protein
MKVSYRPTRMQFGINNGCPKLKQYISIRKSLHSIKSLQDISILDLDGHWTWVLVVPSGVKPYMLLSRERDDYWFSREFNFFLMHRNMCIVDW